MACSAVWRIILFNVRATCQAVVAKRTNKAIVVIFLVEGFNARANDRRVTSGTDNTCVFCIVDFTVRHAAVFEKYVVGERFFARVARETIWMPRGAQSANVGSKYLFVAGLAHWSETRVKARLAVRLSLFFKKVTSWERTDTIHANKAVHVPQFSQCTYTLSLHHLHTACTSRA
mmetsp:Transcript_18591/g.20674  ORF Transcript_18591/g.20674 Transcript_18591/m.20674 type:complete len:174 (-) Transcript_18591:656-1177(-)